MAGTTSKGTSKKLLFFHLMHPQKMCEQPAEVEMLPGPCDGHWPWQAVVSTGDLSPSTPVTGSG